MHCIWTFFWVCTSTPFYLAKKIIIIEPKFIIILIIIITTTIIIIINLLWYIVTNSILIFCGLWFFHFKTLFFSINISNMAWTKSKPSSKACLNLAQNRRIGPLASRKQRHFEAALSSIPSARENDRERRGAEKQRKKERSERGRVRQEQGTSGREKKHFL